MLPLYPDDLSASSFEEGADDNVLSSDDVIIQIGLKYIASSPNRKTADVDRTNMTRAVRRVIERAAEDGLPEDGLPEAEALVTHKAWRTHVRELVREDVRHAVRKRMGIEPRKALVQAVTHEITEEFAVGVKGRYYVYASGYEPETRQDFRDVVLQFFDDVDITINVQLT